MARKEIERIVTQISVDGEQRLEPYGFKVYSQGDEDGILEEIFCRLDIKKGAFAEIGVQDGLECNSLYLLHKGWRGCWIEGDKKFQEKIQKKFRSLLIKKQLRVAFGLVFPNNVNETFDTLGVDNDLDLLSIDIDGNDVYVWQALKVKPKVVCIEYNAKFPPNISKKPVFSTRNFWKGGDYMGSSLLALVEVGVDKGYQLVATSITGSNAFFVRKDLLKGKFPKDGSPESLYNPPRYHLVHDHFSQIGHRPDFGPYVDLEE
jgi:hypothetical protein